MDRRTRIITGVWIGAMVLAAAVPAFAKNNKNFIFREFGGDAIDIVGEDEDALLRMKSEGELPLTLNMTGADVLWFPKKKVLWQDVERIEATYMGEAGRIIGGAPRFFVGLDVNDNGRYDSFYDPTTDTWSGDDRHVFAFWGSGVPPWQEDFSGGWESTGNVITDSAERWDSHDIGGTDHGETYAETVALGGNYRVVAIGISLETGWAQDADTVVEPTDFVSMLLSSINFEGNVLSGEAFAETLIVRITADTNDDGSVDIVDLAAVAANWGTSHGEWAGDYTTSDVTHDGSVDIRDLALVAAQWSPVGGVTHVGGTIAVPTPLGMMGGVVLLGGVAMRRRAS